jgi:hypothetical protein
MFPSSSSSASFVAKHVMPFGALKLELAVLAPGLGGDFAVAKHLMPCGALERATGSVTLFGSHGSHVAKHLMPCGALKQRPRLSDFL